MDILKPSQCLTKGGDVMTTQRKTQAVIVIHGIGEQKPMDTIRSFVDAVLPEHESGVKYFSKPHPMSELYELRKLQNRKQPRTHFFEYYWAHKVEGTTFSHVLSWIKNLLFRLPWHVPEHLRVGWYVSWVLIIAVLISAALGVFNQFTDAASTLPFAVTGIGTVLFGILQGFIINSLGDAARYLSPLPSNIALRRAIRSDGINLLRQIHESPEYDRVILVGHSLGSVIAYDIMKHLWQGYYKTYKTPKKHKQPSIKDVEEAGEALRLDPDNLQNLRKFQDSQVKLWRELRELGNPWLITDFITMGSPLAHAALLLAKDPEDLKERQRQRELPICPPIADECIKRRGEEKCGYSYTCWDPYDINGGSVKLKVLHHAGFFAFTRWTNLYFPAHMGLFGDIVGGPLRKWFGAGVRDIKLTLSKCYGLAKFTMIAHSSYWAKPKKGEKEKKEELSLAALKTALDLDGKHTFAEPTNNTR